MAHAKLFPAGALVALMLAALGATGVGSSSSAADTSAPRRIVDGRPNQYAGIESGPYLGWTEGPFQKPWHHTAIVRRGHKRIEIAPQKGGNVLTDIYGSHALLAHWTKRDADIEVYDFDTKKTHPPWRGLNTPDMERRATRSGPYMLYVTTHFRRRYFDYRYSSTKIILVDVRNHSTRVLARESGRYPSAYPGEVNGNWAVWFGCSRRECHVRRYDIQTKQTETANTPRPAEYAPSVAPNGTAFFAASGIGCGTRVQVYRWPLDGSPEMVHAEKKGIDTVATYASITSNGRERVLFDKASCKTNRADIYRMDFEPAPEPSGSPSGSPSPSPTQCPLPFCPSLSPPALGPR
jgi:hypothetical protein